MTQPLSLFGRVAEELDAHGLSPHSKPSECRAGAVLAQVRSLAPAPAHRHTSDDCWCGLGKRIGIESVPAPLLRLREALDTISAGSYFPNGSCKWCGFTEEDGHEHACATTLARAALSRVQR